MHEGGWPAPNARIRQLAELSALLGIKLWIAQGARDEVRGTFERRIASSIGDLKVAVVQNLERVLQRQKAELFEELTASDAKRQQLAREAILRDSQVIDGFLAENLEIGPRDVDGLEGWLKKPLSFRLSDVESVSLSPALEDVRCGDVV